MASNSQREPSHRPRSWKQAGKAKSSPSSGRFGRSFLAFLTVALCILFVAWLFDWTKPLRTQVVTVSIPEFDVNYVAPDIAYAREDVKAIGLALQSIDGSNFIDKPLMTRSNSVRELADEIERGLMDETNVSITYLNAHGFSDNGEAYFLCSDFLRDSIESIRGGTYPVGQLLSDFARKESPVALKLLILDSGRLATAPRLGMIVNEFPRIVEQQVRGLAEQQFWVLLSNTTFQTSRVDYARRQSVFCTSIVEGLQGAADGSIDGSDPDGYVNLAELYIFVWQRCAQLAGEIGVSPQTPLLMKAGTGLVRAEDLSRAEFGETIYRLVKAERRDAAGSIDERSAGDTEGLGDVHDSVDAQKAEKESSSSGESAVAANDESSPNDASTRDDSAAADSTAEEPDVASSSPGNRKSADAEEGAAATAGKVLDARREEVNASWPPRLQTLYRAWALRDQIQNRENYASRWSPIDFAPHLWRRLNAQLLIYERRLLTQFRGALDTSSAIESDQLRPDAYAAAKLHRLEDPGLVVADLSKLLTAFSTVGTASSERINDVTIDDAFGTDIGKRLWRAWTRFHGDESMRSFEQAESSAQLKQVTRALRDYRDAVFLIPSFMDYELEAGPSAPRELPILSLIDDLIAFRNHFVSVDGSPLEPASPWFDRLGELRGSINRKRESCEGIMNRTVEAALKPPLSSRMRVQHEIEALLATAALAAAPRGQLINELMKVSNRNADQPPRIRPRRHEARPPVLTASRDQWMWLLGRTKVQIKAVEHADAEFASKLEPALARVETLMEQLSNEPVEDELWTQYRGIGADLRGFCSQLARRVEGLAGAESSAGAAGHDLLADRLLRAMSPLDALTPEVWKIASIHVVLRRPDDFVQFRFDGRPVQLIDSEGTIELAVDASKRELLEFPVVLEYDRQMLEVEQLLGDVSGNADGTYQRALSLRVRALQDRERAPRKDLPITLRIAWLDGDERQIAEQAIRCGLPYPNRVGVAAKAKGLAQAVDQAEDVVELRVPPNRPTEFELALINDSGRERNVLVSLYSVPHSRGVPPGRISLQTRRLLTDDNTVDTDAGFTQLAETKVSLPREGRQPIDFGASTDIDSKDATEEPADKPDGEGQAATSPSGPDETSGQSESIVTGGLVCVVLDADSKKRIGHKWFQLECLTPSEYLDSKVVYKNETIGIEVSLVDVDHDGKPDFALDAPISLAWTDRVSPWLAPSYIPLQAKQKRVGFVTAERPAERLAASLDTADRLDGVLPVAVNVDGYPRGVDHDVPARDDDSGIERTRSRTRIRISRVAIPGFRRVYHWPGQVEAWTPPKDGESEKLQHIALRNGEPAVFPAPEPMVLVDFQTDVPADMWTDPRHRIEIGFRGQRPTNFYGARQVTTSLLSTGPALRLRMDVSDYQVELVTASPENTEVVIDARIRSPGIQEHELDEREDECMIQFDSDLPRIMDVVLSAGDPSAERRRLRVRAADFSGIERVEFGFDQDGSGTPDPAGDTMTTQSLHLTGVTGSEFGQTHSFEISVATKEIMKDLQPGESVDRLFFVRAWDKVEHEGEFFQTRLRFNKPVEDVAPAPAQVKTTDVVGEIRYGGTTRINAVLFRATLEGPEIGLKPIDVAGDGGVRIENLKPGEYRLTVTGAHTGRTVEGTKQIIIPASPPALTNIGVITVQRRTNQDPE